MSTVAYPHIELDSQAKPRIAGTGFKVRVLAEAYRDGADAARLHETYPQLSLAQIYAALAYYHDHQAAFDAEIAKLEQLEQELIAETANSDLAARLRARMAQSS